MRQQHAGRRGPSRSASVRKSTQSSASYPTDPPLRRALVPRESTVVPMSSVRSGVNLASARQKQGKLCTGLEVEEGRSINTERFPAFIASWPTSSSAVDNCFVENSPEIDTERSTAKLLYSLGAVHPIAFLSRFPVSEIVYCLDQVAGSVARASGWYLDDEEDEGCPPHDLVEEGEGIHNLPGYLWRLLEDRERLRESGR